MVKKFANDSNSKHKYAKIDEVIDWILKINKIFHFIIRFKSSPDNKPSIMPLLSDMLNVLPLLLNIIYVKQ